MKDVARALAQAHTSGLSPETLLALARRDPWLKSGRGGRSHSKYPGEKTQSVAEKLLRYLQSELRIVVDTFWEGRTSTELVVRGSSVELEGFFNGERPGRTGSHNGAAGGPQNGRHDDTHQRSGPYA